MELKRGDIVLIPFPFTDLTSAKVRPAVIISANPQSDDITIAFISSVIPNAIGKTDFLFTAKNPDFATTGLKKDSLFKMSKLLTISSMLIIRRLGQITPHIQKKLDSLLKKALGLE